MTKRWFVMCLKKPCFDSDTEPTWSEYCRHRTEKSARRCMGILADEHPHALMYLHSFNKQIKPKPKGRKA